VRTDDWRRYVGPAAFLLAVTVAIVLIRAGMNAGGKSPARTGSASSPARRHVTTTTAGRPHKPPVARRFYTVQAGDTFSIISMRTGVSVATIARLNPKASSTSLHIGERVRIK
jgi:LysM repeat protein